VVEENTRLGSPPPSAPLGQYIGYYLGGGGIPLSTSALKGVEAEVKIHTEFDPLENDDTFALLQELGTVLQVSVPDILNRSTDRSATLTEYSTALRNITERAQSTAEDLQIYQKSLKAEEKTQRTTLNDLQKRYDKAIKAIDFATAASLQKTLNEAQTALSQTQSKGKETTSTLEAYTSLLEVSMKRLQAIDQNREILVAGLKVIEVPGIEDLGILEQLKKSRNLGTGILGM
jgi:cysteinyl-tRNA synthetase